VSKTMRVGELNAGGSAMVAEQGAQSRSAHTCSVCRSFQHDEQCGLRGTEPMREHQTRTRLSQVPRCNCRWDTPGPTR
jgi:hypothetical protein